MSTMLDTSIVIPYLGSVAYDRYVVQRVVRDRVSISSVTGMELLAGSLNINQRRKAEAFISGLNRRGLIVTPTLDEWLRAGRMVARYQNQFGRIDPAQHVNDILILLAAQRSGAELATENGDHFENWSRYLRPSQRPRLVIMTRAEHSNR